MSSAYPYGFLTLLSSESAVINKIVLVLLHAWNNFGLWFSISNGPIVLIITRYAYTLLVLYLGVKTIKRICKKDFAFCGADSIYLYIVIISVIAWILQIAFYDVFGFRDYRVLYPFIWMAAIASCIYNKKMYYTYIVLQLMTLWLAPINVEGYFSELDAQSYESISTNVFYDENADTRWDNTVYQDIGADIYDDLLLPQGIGLVWGEMNEEYIIDKKPRYILTMQVVDINGYRFYSFCGEKKLYIREDGKLDSYLNSKNTNQLIEAKSER